MVHYIGLDVSLKQTSICVVNQLGSVVREGVVDSEPEAIAAFVRTKAPRVVRVGLETGPTATWLWTELKRLGLPVICIDARHAKAVLKMQINKSDRNDAAGIARIMQTGWFTQVLCHNRSGAAQESERARQHSLIAHWYQIGQTGTVSCCKDRHGITIGSSKQVCMILTDNLAA